MGLRWPPRLPWPWSTSSSSSGCAGRWGSAAACWGEARRGDVAWRDVGRGAGRGGAGSGFCPLSRSACFVNSVYKTWPPREGAGKVSQSQSKRPAPSSYATGGSTGDGINVAVVDTGIDLDHPYLADNVEGEYMALAEVGRYRKNRAPDDDNGHGTHVAGIIAAEDNAQGVVGVAPDANLYAVKVLDQNGSGYLSDVIDGINWAESRNTDDTTTNDIHVINMS